MKPEKQRIAIAEACGWTITGAQNEPDVGYIAQGYPANGKYSDKQLAIPDYLNDLNAMMEAFKHVGRHWKIEQVEDGFVCTIQFGPRNKDVVAGGLELCPVMAEAFLRTFNKWEN